MLMQLTNALFSLSPRPHQRAVGDGAETEAGETPDAEAGAEGSLPHAETPDALSPPKGTYISTLGVYCPVYNSCSHLYTVYYQ